MKDIDDETDKIIVRDYHKREIKVKGDKGKLKDYLRRKEVASNLKLLLQVKRG